MGAGYYFLGNIEKEWFGEETSWIEIQEQDTAGWFSAYVYSFYWAYTSMLLIGAYPYTLSEMIYTILTLFLLVGVFAKIISNISDLLNSLEAKYKDYKKDKELLRQFFDRQNISKVLQSELLNYLKYNYIGHEDKVANQEVSQVLEQFPQLLQGKIKEEKYQKHMKGFKIINENFSKKVQELLLEYMGQLLYYYLKIYQYEYLYTNKYSHIEEEYIMPNQVLMTEHCYEEPRIYLIIKGNVYGTYTQKSAIQNNQNNQTNEEQKDEQQLFILKEGTTFGEREFFLDTFPHFTYRSQGFSTILSLKRSVFLEILTNSGNEDIQNYHMLKDTAITEGYADKISIKCNLCDREGLHYEQNCNVVHYIPPKLPLITRNNFSEPHTKKYIISQKLQNPYIRINRPDKKWKTQFFTKENFDDLKEKMSKNKSLIIFIKSIREQQIQSHMQKIGKTKTADCDSSYCSDDCSNPDDQENAVQSMMKSDPYKSQGRFSRSKPNQVQDGIQESSDEDQDSMSSVKSIKNVQDIEQALGRAGLQKQSTRLQLRANNLNGNNIYGRMVQQRDEADLMQQSENDQSINEDGMDILAAKSVSGGGSYPRQKQYIGSYPRSKKSQFSARTSIQKIDPRQLVGDYSSQVSKHEKLEFFEENNQLELFSQPDMILETSFPQFQTVKFNGFDDNTGSVVIQQQIQNKMSLDTLDQNLQQRKLIDPQLSSIQQDDTEKQSIQSQQQESILRRQSKQGLLNMFQNEKQKLKQNNEQKVVQMKLDQIVKEDKDLQKKQIKQDNKILLKQDRKQSQFMNRISKAASQNKGKLGFLEDQDKIKKVFELWQMKYQIANFQNEIMKGGNAPDTPAVLKNYIKDVDAEFTQLQVKLTPAEKRKKLGEEFKEEFFWSFDKKQEYSWYFPKGNFLYVVHHYKKNHMKLRQALIGDIKKSRPM